MRKFYSQTRKKIITEEELYKEYLKSKEYDEDMRLYTNFEDYVYDCDCSRGGDFEEVYEDDAH